MSLGSPLCYLFILYAIHTTGVAALDCYVNAANSNSTEELTTTNSTGCFVSSDYLANFFSRGHCKNDCSDELSLSGVSTYVCHRDACNNLLPSALNTFQNCRWCLGDCRQTKNIRTSAGLICLSGKTAKGELQYLPCGLFDCSDRPDSIVAFQACRSPLCNRAYTENRVSCLKCKDCSKTAKSVADDTKVTIAAGAACIAGAKLSGSFDREACTRKDCTDLKSSYIDIGVKVCSAESLCNKWIWEDIVKDIYTTAATEILSSKANDDPTTPVAQKTTKAEEATATQVMTAAPTKERSTTPKTTEAKPTFTREAVTQENRETTLEDLTTASSAIKSTTFKSDTNRWTTPPTMRTTTAASGSEKNPIFLKLLMDIDLKLTIK